MTPPSSWDWVRRRKTSVRELHLPKHNSISEADAEKIAEAIKPTSAVLKAPEEESSALSSGQSENPRNGRFCCYVVTKTDTETSYVITATTSVTLKCTPARSILPECE